MGTKTDLKKCFYDGFRSSDIITRMGWAGHETRIDEMRNDAKLWAGKLN
jgi:hypothetical protein